MRKKGKSQVVFFIKSTIITILAKELMKRKGTSMLINIINLSLQMFREYHPPDMPGINIEVKTIKSKGATYIDGFQNNNSEWPCQYFRNYKAHSNL